MPRSTKAQTRVKLHTSTYEVCGSGKDMHVHIRRHDGSRKIVHHSNKSLPKTVKKMITSLRKPPRG